MEREYVKLIWKDFKRQAQEIAEQAELSLGQNGLAMIGTIRSDGSPRISPVEIFVLREDILIGMMRQSRKALDLLRDSRCVLHNTISDPNGSEAEFKLYGRAVAGNEPMRKRYCIAYAARWKRNPPKSFPGHVFSMDIDSAAFIRYDTKRNQMIVKQWSYKLGLREDKRSYP